MNLLQRNEARYGLPVLHCDGSKSYERIDVWPAQHNWMLEKLSSLIQGCTGSSEILTNTEYSERHNHREGYNRTCRLPSSRQFRAPVALIRS